MLQVDYLVVGSGLTGSVIARQLNDSGREVLVVEKRSDLGGNVHDTLHSSGIRVHTYGPHYFRTSSQLVWDFATRFSDFYRYEAIVVSKWDNLYIQWPIKKSFIRIIAGKNWTPGYQGKAHNFEQAILTLMPVDVYKMLIKEYTTKQWGCNPKVLSPSLFKRLTVRNDDDPRLTPNAQFQGIPIAGYSQWITNMLHGIPVLRNYDYLQRRNDIHVRKGLVFTGPIDAFFHYDLGRLRYRSQHRVHHYYPKINYLQACGQVNCPKISDGEYIRTLEWKHMMPSYEANRSVGTIITKEIPCDSSESDNPEYPFPDSCNRQLYSAYRSRASWLPNTWICGRLGEYKYYDMDQAIARALSLSKKVINRKSRLTNIGVTV